MKFLFFLGVIALTVCSCTTELIKENLPDFTQPNECHNLTETLSIDEALQVAIDARSTFYNKASRSVQPTTLSVIPISSISSRSTQIDTLIYVVNYESEDGYAVVSAKRGTKSLLGYIEQGHFSTVDSLDDTGIKDFFDLAQLYVENAPVATYTPNSFQISYTWNDTTTNIRSNVEPRIKTNWGQYKAGYYCPNGVSGCNPLAGATALSYIESPSSLSLSFPGAPTSSIDIDWNKIKLHNDYTSLSLICREIGHKINAIYYEDYQTEARISNLYNYFSQLIGKTRVGTFKREAPNGYDNLGDGIIIMAGHRVEDDGTTSGHTWIIDGYKFSKVVYDRYSQPMKIINGKPVYTLDGKPWLTGTKTHQGTFTHIDNYNHINWGWSGSNNGYFLADIFDPNKGDYDNPDYNFTYPDYDIDFMYFVVR